MCLPCCSSSPPKPRGSEIVKANPLTADKLTDTKKMEAEMTKADKVFKEKDKI